ncbi:type II toxin-antitoxin system death-on-curing family toxin [Sphingomonas ursincola]|uniref:type II toxin-antitoxin system death-on-curing family toxin n=1 Tax=Blastomonas TaxID=150203 RepID=UPI00083785D6|nr:type II toxin-antitoxin system death-on-curing family toxin [Sphingomonas ursincola]MBA4780646.1 type II toxin-antitoxin system death-on-curing family toxin [Blastomonas sp.]MBY0620998.1 type II toxin-antitoxin system death-on-curing family toxin [Sphingomonas ursincola]MCH2239558.1 type II toxin-antitoxin system death-on-curing family toxin [Blastomonas sp.]
MADWIWVRQDVVLALHDEQIAEHGGLSGIRDPALVESALARPLNLAAYGEPDAADLAAAYAFGLARNHPFADGNKRSAAVVALTFLLLNDVAFEITEAELVVMTMALAAGDLSEEEVARWFRDHIVERG